MANILENITGGVSDFTSKIANVFDNGFNVYTSIDDRLRAIKQISKETIISNPPAAAAPAQIKAEEDLNRQTQKSLQTASLALIAAGILFVLLLVLIAKRKRG